MGKRREAERFYINEIRQFHEQVGDKYVRLPYTFFHTAPTGEIYGDFANGSAGCRFEDIRLHLTTEPFHPVREMHDLWRLSSLLQVDKEFNALESNTFVRGLRIVEGKLELSIGAGLFPEAAYSVNSDSLVIDLPKERRKVLEACLKDRFEELLSLLKYFHRKYGKVSVREVVYKKYKRVPPFGEAYSYIMGGVALLRTTDRKLILTRRSPRGTSVNHGINVPTSGGAIFNHERLVDWGLPLYLQTEMLREAREELGIVGKDCKVMPLGLVRELTRGCTPDALHMIFYRCTAEEIIPVIAGNPHPSRREIDDWVFALDVDDAGRLVRDQRAEEVLQHKALVALILADRAGYLE